MKWTKNPAALERLQKHVDKRLSCSAIASLMGVTKNAIVGACHRFGMQLQSQNRSGARIGARPQLSDVSARVSRSEDMKKMNKTPAMSKKPGKLAGGRAYVIAPNAQNSGPSFCMWAGCHEHSIARGKPYCARHFLEYRKAS
jgi:hypothetical protein